MQDFSFGDLSLDNLNFTNQVNSSINLETIAFTNEQALHQSGDARRLQQV